MRNTQFRCTPAVEALEDRCLLSAGLDANQAYVQSLYQADLGRSGSSAELTYWSSVLQTQGLAAVANGIDHSGEARAFLVKGLYEQLLGRDPAPGEAQGFVTALQNGQASEEQIAGLMLASGEFYQDAPAVAGSPHDAASDALFVRALYEELLNRAPSSAEISHYTSLLPTAGRQAVAMQFLNSTEFRTDMVQAFYGTDSQFGVLGRTIAPSTAEVNSWVNTPLTLGQIHTALEASPEKFGLGSHGYDINQQFVQGLYQDALGRTGSAGELTYWEQLELTNGTVAVVHNINNSSEAQSHLVASWYSTYLGRNPQPGEDQAFVNELQAGVAPERVLAQIVSSNEFFTHAPQLISINSGTPSNQTYVTALFREFLQRTPSPAELQNYALRVVPAVGPEQAAEAILFSSEYRGDVVRAFYSTLLQRPTAPSDAEVNGWTGSGMSLWWICDAIESTNEFAAAQPHFVTLGDSLTDAYTADTTGLRSSRGDESWVQQLQALRSSTLTIANLAVSGATTTTLLQQTHTSSSQGQPQAAAALIHSGQAQYAVLIIGANDIGAYLNQVIANVSQGKAVPDFGPTLQTIMANLTQALTTLQAAGNVRIILGTIPDISQTPYLQQQFAGNADLTKLVAGVTSATNQQIKLLAAAHNLPVVDLQALGAAVATSLTLGGHAVQALYAPDAFHPATPPQALLANAVLAAAHDAYGVRVAGLELSDQEILGEVGIHASGGPTYFSVQSYVSANTTGSPEPLAALGVA
jgi:lysophospholipase L1-like esterase